ncbi:hypothetical protein [Brevibacillus daliensis]|uniref:hypothetical protein n=1 Tax=Brevibacillus daliensis TaxID=2892995 RepID=UPI001E3F056D|nr:hypothetical protein [Brevibacillus daliensis]
MGYSAFVFALLGVWGARSGWKSGESQKEVVARKRNHGLRFFFPDFHPPLGEATPDATYPTILLLLRHFG